ncbi:hypothetical protein AVEN_36478-1 [Araneus ventricosus]|uniref:CRAL/TRIO N-terminal domain-containing protein n=1 Tax=Araneus ventricosus TaxID=182803 RepID=A0A4Y2VHN7_ARAVE|nr:hypothetical protein AVEN_36478-1 [Araneus ventricosus]
MDSAPACFLPFAARDIDDPSLLSNKKQINESSESRRRCLELLRNSLKNLEGIKPCLDENFLLRFLRVSKFDVSKALQRQKKYHQQSDAILDAFKKCSSSLYKLRNLNHLWVSPYRLKDNSALIIALNSKCLVFLISTGHVKLREVE